MATLYVVATPIGNLEDITLRALEVLKGVSFVICEDTRHSRILLEKYGIRSERVSLPAFAERDRADRLIDRIEKEQSAALITDAGTPGISDPGELLIARSIERGLSVVPIPGASAILAALAASGLPAGRFHFVGFLPRKGTDRTGLLEEISPLRSTLAFYESPKRLAETLEELAGAWGPRRACVARELTKAHEELVRGTVKELAERYRGQDVLGEVVLLVEGRVEQERWDERQVRSALQEGLRRKEPLKALSKEVAQRSGWPGSAVYKLGLSERE